MQWPTDPVAVVFMITRAGALRGSGRLGPRMTGGWPGPRASVLGQAPTGPSAPATTPVLCALS